MPLPPPRFGPHNQARRLSSSELQDLLRLIWDTTVALLKDAVNIQKTGEMFDNPGGRLSDLSFLVDDISKVNSTSFNFQELEMIDFARKFACLLRGMKGIRLRQLSREELERIIVDSAAAYKEKQIDNFDDLCGDESIQQKEEEAPRITKKRCASDPLENTTGKKISLDVAPFSTSLSTPRDPGSSGRYLIPEAPISSSNIVNVNAGLKFVRITEPKWAAKAMKKPSSDINNIPLLNPPKSVTGAPIRCEYCSEMFIRSEFLEHIKICPKYDEAKAQKMTKMSSSSSTKENSAPLTSSEIHCCYDLGCDYESKSKEEVIEHYAAIHNGQYNLWKATGRMKFLRSHDRSDNVCSDCQFSVLSTEGFRRHMLINHPKSVHTEKKIFLCMSCGERFNRLHLMYSHWHERAEECMARMRIDTSETTVFEPRVVRAPPRIETMLQCAQLRCDFECQTEVELVDHSKVLHGRKYIEWIRTGRLELKASSCPYCQFAMEDVESFFFHINKWHHKSVLHKKRVFSCTSCNLLFGRLHNVYEHWLESEECTGMIRINEVSRYLSNKAILDRDH